jgi:hypothetical protein
MIFVTHRFGHLTKHADLIMSVNTSSADYSALSNKIDA